MRILLVEDDPQITNAYARALEKAGHTCIFAYSKTQAIARLARQDSGQEPAIDLMILDVNLGDMNDGAAVAMRAQIYERVKTVVISGYTREHAEGAILHPFARVLQWLSKPVSEQELMNTVLRVERYR